MSGVLQQPVLPVLPQRATRIGPVAALVEGADGGVVHVSGLVTFAFAAGDEVGRRLAAVQLVRTKTASAVAVAAAFKVSTTTLWRWVADFDAGGDAGGVAGLAPGNAARKGRAS